MKARGANAWRWLVAAILSGGIVFVPATPALANHDEHDWDDPYHFCQIVDSDMADVEEGPVSTDTATVYGSCGYAASGSPSDEIPRTVGDTGGKRGAGGAGDVGADADDIVPAARIDAGGGGAAAGAHAGAVAGVLAVGSVALGALATRRRR